jgi:hypothetical protein
VKLGIVGCAQDKFTPRTEYKARGIIFELIAEYDPEVVVSGHCHLGGVDIYAEEIGALCGRKLEIHEPKTKRWHDGYKPRNLLIAKADVVACIVVADYPPNYTGMRFSGCYHCGTRNLPHVKSGGCWTAWQAKERTWRFV